MKKKRSAKLRKESSFGLLPIGQYSCQIGLKRAYINVSLERKSESGWEIIHCIVDWLNLIANY